MSISPFLLMQITFFFFLLEEIQRIITEGIRAEEIWF